MAAAPVPPASHDECLRIRLVVPAASPLRRRTSGAGELKVRDKHARVVDDPTAGFPKADTVVSVLVVGGLVATIKLPEFKEQSLGVSRNAAEQ